MVFDGETARRMDEFLKSDFRWAVHILSDINFIANLVNKSMIPLIDSETRNRVLKIQNAVSNRPDLLTKESYYFIMNMVNSVIEDDHTHI